MIKFEKAILEKAIGWFIPLSLAIIIWTIYVAAQGDFNFWRGDALRGFGLWTLVVGLIGVVIKKAFKQSASALLSILLLIFLLSAVGVLSSLVAIGLVLAAGLLGKLILFFFGMNNTDTRFYEVLIIGVVIYLAVFGGMIHFEINYPLVYSLVVLSPLLAFASPIFRNSVLEQLSLTQKLVKGALAELNYWHFLAFVWLVGYIATYTFLPVVMSDDNNYHLGMWTQLTFHHQYLFDVKTLIWAVSPFAVDLLHSIISLISGSNARASLNMTFYLLLMMGLWSLSGKFLLESSKKLLVLAAFASTPMLANLLQSLQTDLFLALLAVAGGLVLLDKQRHTFYRLLSVVLLGGLLCATKLPAVVLAGALLIGLLVSIYSNKSSQPKPYYSLVGTGVLLAAAVFVALHSYVAAFLVTKNPFFPLYNAIFKSPFFREENFKDGLYSKGASLDSYWGLFFDSQSYFESPADFVAGFQYLFLLPCALLLLLVRRDVRWLAILAIPMIIYAGVMFYMMQYLRYLFAILPLASVLIAYLYATRINKNTITAVLCASVFLNLWFLPGVSFNFYLNNLEFLSASKKQEALAALNPEIAMNDYVNSHYGIKNVLYDVSRSNGATLAGTPFYLSWCAPLHMRVADGWNGEEDVLKFLKLNNIELIYWYKPLAEADNYFRADIKRIIENYGVLEKEVNGLQLYKISVNQ